MSSVSGGNTAISPRKGLTHPCLAPEGAEPFPLDASVVVGPDWAQRYSFPRGVASEVHRLVGRMGAELAERSNVGYAELDPDVARGSFGRRLARFLGSRFRVNSQEITATTSGLDFTVHTQSSGLRVQFSPAYWFSPRVFGAPTTPVSRPMPPGRFIFGAEGPYLPLQFDSAEYDLPPMTSATLYA